MVRLSIAPFDAAYQTYSPGLPMVAAPDDRLTMAPPCPPCRRAMRRIAARAHQMLPSTLTSLTPRTVSAGAPSRRLTRPAPPPSYPMAVLRGTADVAAAQRRAPSSTTEQRLEGQGNE